ATIIQYLAARDAHGCRHSPTPMNPRVTTALTKEIWRGRKIAQNRAHGQWKNPGRSSAPTGHAAGGRAEAAPHRRPSVAGCSRQTRRGNGRGNGPRELCGVRAARHLPAKPKLRMRTTAVHTRAFPFIEACACSPAGFSLYSGSYTSRSFFLTMILLRFCGLAHWGKGHAVCGEFYITVPYSLRKRCARGTRRERYSQRVIHLRGGGRGEESILPQRGKGSGSIELFHRTGSLALCKSAEKIFARPSGRRTGLHPGVSEVIRSRACRRHSGPPSGAWPRWGVPGAKTRLSRLRGGA